MDTQIKPAPRFYCDLGRLSDGSPPIGSPMWNQVSEPPSPRYLSGVVDTWSRLPNGEVHVKFTSPQLTWDPPADARALTHVGEALTFIHAIDSATVEFEAG